MSKITNDGLTRFGTGCFIAEPANMAKFGVKGLKISAAVITNIIKLIIILIIINGNNNI